MDSKYFSTGFIGFLALIILVLFFIYSNLSVVDNSGEALSIFWAALILLFLIFGIIIISLFLGKVREKSKKD